MSELVLLLPPQRGIAEFWHWVADRLSVSRKKPTCQKNLGEWAFLFAPAKSTQFQWILERTTTHILSKTYRNAHCILAHALGTARYIANSL